MRVLLTSAGLEAEEIKACFVDMAGKEMSCVKALFIPTAAIDADAIEVLPKCMNDLLKCGILDKNIKVYDLHTGMELEELQQYDGIFVRRQHTLLIGKNQCNRVLSISDGVYQWRWPGNRGKCRKPYFF